MMIFFFLFGTKKKKSGGGGKRKLGSTHCNDLMLGDSGDYAHEWVADVRPEYDECDPRVDDGLVAILDDRGRFRKQMHTLHAYNQSSFHVSVVCLVLRREKKKVEEEEETNWKRSREICSASSVSTLVPGLM